MTRWKLGRAVDEDGREVEGFSAAAADGVRSSVGVDSGRVPLVLLEGGRRDVDGEEERGRVLEALLPICRVLTTGEVDRRTDEGLSGFAKKAADRASEVATAMAAAFDA